MFLAGAFGALALAQLRAGVSVEKSVGILGGLLAQPLVSAFGWPAAVMIPLVPAVHALRVFGRMESDTDRSWMIFFGGLVVLLPIALALTLASPPPGLPSAGAGWWGALIAHWWTAWFGVFGAWVIVALVGSVLMAATLAWNPIRAVIGHRPSEGAAVADDAAVASGEEPSSKRRKKREKTDAGGDANLALALEPAPEEMPAIDPSLIAASAAASSELSDSLDLDQKRRKKKSKADVAADHDAGLPPRSKPREPSTAAARSFRRRSC